MNYYDALTKLRAKLRASKNLMDTSLPITDLLDLLKDGEIEAVSRMNAPRVTSYIPITAGTGKYEFRLGREAYPEGTDTAHVKVPEAVTDTVAVETHAPTYFSATSPWNKKITAPKVLDQSAEMIEFSMASGAAEGKLYISKSDYSVPIFEVGPQDNPISGTVSVGASGVSYNAGTNVTRINIDDISEESWDSEIPEQYRIDFSTGLLSGDSFDVVAMGAGEGTAGYIDVSGNASTAAIGSQFRVFGYEAPWETITFNIPTAWLPIANPPGFTCTGSPSDSTRTAHVPMPYGTLAATGADGHCVIIDTTNNKAYDFYQLVYSAETGWSATYGAAWDLDGTGYNAVYSAGARAAGTPLLGGLITYDEIASGYIPHALAIAIPVIHTSIITNPPASATQTGTANPLAIPMGARIQLDPNLDLDTLDLTDNAKVIARALQEYGAYVVDGSQTNVVYAEDLEHSTAATWEGILETNDLIALTRDYLRVIDPLAVQESPTGALEYADSPDRLKRNTRQPWTDSVCSPIMDQQITMVEFRESASQPYKPLERIHLDDLPEGVTDVTSLGTGVPRYWYYTTDIDMFMYGDHSAAIGVVPQPVLAATDAYAIRITYVPFPDAVTGCVWGSGVSESDSETPSQTLTVKCAFKSANVYFSGAVFQRQLKSVSQIIYELGAGTISLPAESLSVGYEFGVVRTVGGRVPRWYQIRSVTLVSDLDGYADHIAANPNDAQYGDYVVGFKIHPRFIDTGAGVYDNEMLFVISTRGLLGRTYPAHCDTVVNYAAWQYLTAAGDARAGAFEAMYEKGLALASAAIYGSLK
jgi:hypothetical protein